MTDRFRQVAPLPRLEPTLDISLYTARGPGESLAIERAAGRSRPFVAKAILMEISVVDMVWSPAFSLWANRTHAPSHINRLYENWLFVQQNPLAGGSPASGAVTVMTVAGGGRDTQRCGVVTRDRTPVIRQTDVGNVCVVLIPISQTIDSTRGTPGFPTRFPGTRVAGDGGRGVSVDRMARGTVDGDRWLVDDIADRDAGRLSGGGGGLRGQRGGWYCLRVVERLGSEGEGE